MPEKININPFTRISGFLEISADIEKNRIIGAKMQGHLFRGFEKMLSGRDPFDAVYFTQRICGICSAAHSVASSLALEDAMDFAVTQQGRYLRDIVHGCEFLQNHLRHFYQYTLPDYVRLPEQYPLFLTQHEDYRLPKAKNDKMVKDYFASLEISRSAHQMLAILGGKAPHNHGFFIGGITTQATVDNILSLASMLDAIEIFAKETMLPDVYEIAHYYPEYFKLGGGYGHLLSYGCFDHYKELGTLYVDSLVYANGKTEPFQVDDVKQVTEYAWFKNGETDLQKPDAYTWIKAPRYQNMPFEVGPLARQWLCGEYKNGISAMDRTIARALEVIKIISVIKILLQNLIPDLSVQEVYTMPADTSGQGLVDTTRGALGHWLTIRGGKIASYQIITPSAWNLSPKSGNHPGTAEQALIGTPVQNADAPVEIGRIVRSFDPCVSCATHVYHAGTLMNTYPIV